MMNEGSPQNESSTMLHAFGAIQRWRLKVKLFTRKIGFKVEYWDLQMSVNSLSFWEMFYRRRNIVLELWKPIHTRSHGRGFLAKFEGSAEDRIHGYIKVPLPLFCFWKSDFVSVQPISKCNTSVGQWVTSCGISANSLAEQFPQLLPPTADLWPHISHCLKVGSPIPRRSEKQGSPALLMEISSINGDLLWDQMLAEAVNKSLSLYYGIKTSVYAWIRNKSQSVENI